MTLPAQSMQFVLGKQDEQSFITLKHFEQTLTGPVFCTRYLRGDKYAAGVSDSPPPTPRIRPLALALAAAISG